MSENANISLLELHQVVSLIDTAISRGAYRGSELVAVGTVYNKLVSFIQHASEQTKNEEVN